MYEVKVTQVSQSSFDIPNELQATAEEYNGRFVSAESPNTTVFSFPSIEDAEGFKDDARGWFGSLLNVGSIKER